MEINGVLSRILTSALIVFAKQAKLAKSAGDLDRRFCPSSGTIMEECPTDEPVQVPEPALDGALGFVVSQTFSVLVVEDDSVSSLVALLCTAVL